MLFFADDVMSTIRGFLTRGDNPEVYVAHPTRPDECVVLQADLVYVHPLDHNVLGTEADNYVPKGDEGIDWVEAWRIGWNATDVEEPR